MKLRTQTKSLLAAAIGSAFALVAAPSHADLFAISKLVVTDFVIYGSDGSVLDYEDDFSSISFTSSADYDGELTGTPGFSASDPNSTTGINFPTACLSTTGDCNPLTEDNFEFLTGPQGEDYVAADQLQDGSPLTNTPNFGATAGADVGQESVASLSATEAEGTANVNNGLEASFIFQLAQSTGITFSGNFESYLEAFASAGELAPGKAAAAMSFSIVIDCIGNCAGEGRVFDSANIAAFNSLFNQSVAVNPDDYPFDIQNCGTYTCGTQTAGSFALTTGTLSNTKLYQLTIRSNANVDIARVAVPEPGTLALLGLGLAGLGMRRRRLT